MATLDSMGYRALCLRDAVTHLDTEGCWPQGAVVLTFDDGYENLHRYALPTLSRHGFSATVFLVSGHVGGRNDWATPPPGLGIQRMMNWQQATDLVRSGWEAGAHTLTHPDLRSLAREEVEHEMRASRHDVEDHLGQAVESFAYPYGYTTDLVTSIADGEFRAACTTELSCATFEPLHSLPRIDSFYLQKPGHLRSLVEGRLDRYVMFRRWGRGVRALLSG